MYLNDHLNINEHIEFIRSMLDDIPADLHAQGYPKPQMSLRDLIKHNLDWISTILSRGHGQ